MASGLKILNRLFVHRKTKKMKKFNILIALTLTTMICLADTQNFSVTTNTLWSTKNYSVVAAN